MASISYEDPVVQSYIFYSAVLALKMFAVVFLTGRARFAKNVFSNEEDIQGKKGAKVKFDDPDVERVRRAHLNDLENIPAFWILGALYVTTGPAVWWAKMLFRLFTAARILHTFVYAVKPLPQPARALSFGIAFLVNVYMAVTTVLYYVSAW